MTNLSIISIRVVAVAVAAEIPEIVPFVVIVSSFYEKFLHSRIEWICETHIVFAPVVTRCMELVFSIYGRLKETGDSVKAPMELGGGGDFVAGHKDLKGDIVRIVLEGGVGDSVIVPVLAPEAMLTWVYGLARSWDFLTGQASNLEEARLGHYAFRTINLDVDCCSIETCAGDRELLSARCVAATGADACDRRHNSHIVAVARVNVAVFRG